jgi:hypothetical protein
MLRTIVVLLSLAMFAAALSGCRARAEVDPDRRAELPPIHVAI